MCDIGSKIPDFSVPSSDGSQVTHETLKGRYGVLYFYPKDNTPGCTTEALDFTALRSEFAAYDCDIYGVSKDSLKKHDNFITKHDLAIALLADIEGTLCESFGVWVEKKNYGRTYMGIERSTFLIAPDGTLLNVWRKVRVKEHAQTVLSALKDAHA